jgi:predicted small metal-binding protein
VTTVGRRRCRDGASESNCTLAIAGDDVDDLLDAAVLHASTKHGHDDTAVLREGAQASLKPVEPAMV